MKLAGKLAAVGMLLLLTGLPAMACILPDAQMTEAERACCREMAKQCGDMGASSGHSCCQTVVQPQQAALLKHLSSTDRPTDLIAFVASVDPTANLTSPTVIDVPLSWRHPPPLLAAYSTILRI